MSPVAVIVPRSSPLQSHQVTLVLFVSLLYNTDPVRCVCPNQAIVGQKKEFPMLAATLMAAFSKTKLKPDAISRIQLVRAGFSARPPLRPLAIAVGFQARQSSGGRSVSNAVVS